MNKDEIKKALGYCASDSIDDCKNCPYADNGPFACSISMYKDALNIITEQEEEIERLKDDYAKLQELFAQYQMASDKEIRAQKKQAKIDVLNELKKRIYDISPYNPLVTKDNVKYFIDKFIKEIQE